MDFNFRDLNESRNPRKLEPHD